MASLRSFMSTFSPEETTEVVVVVVVVIPLSLILVMVSDSGLLTAVCSGDPDLDPDTIVRFSSLELRDVLGLIPELSPLCLFLLICALRSGSSGIRSDDDEDGDEGDGERERNGEELVLPPSSSIESSLPLAVSCSLLPPLLLVSFSLSIHNNLAGDECM